MRQRSDAWLQQKKLLSRRLRERSSRMRPEELKLALRCPRMSSVRRNWRRKMRHWRLKL